MAVFNAAEIYWKNSFQTNLINSKKISKNVKFGLQAHFNIDWISNGLDRQFGLWKWKK